MIAIDLSNNVVEGGLFLLKEAAKAAPFAWSPDGPDPQRFVGTYRGSGAPIRDALVDMIRCAQRRVFIASFVLGDEQIIEELIAAADRLRGGVYVITALDERSLGRGLREYEQNEQESPEERRKNFERLTSRGIYVRGHASCHAKFAVVDERIGLVGSANFVTQGFTWTGEADILLTDFAQVRQLRRLFTELWFSGCTWEIPPGETYLVAERAVQEPPCRPDSPSGKSGEVLWTSGPEQMSLLKAIQDTIDAAQEELTLSTYSIVRMTEKPHLILDHIHGALRRGVKTSLFIRQRNAWPEQVAELVALHDAGVEILADLRNHAKVAIADSKQAVVFSANLDGDHGLDSGVEVGIRVSHPGCLHDLNRYMNHVIANADTEFARNPTLRQLNGRLAARWCSTWHWADEVSIKCQADEARQFASAARSGPVLYEHEQNQDRISLYAGSLKFDVDTLHPEWVGRIAGASNLDSTNLLRDWLETVRRSGGGSEVRRGFCAATLLLGNSTD